LLIISFAIVNKTTKIVPIKDLMGIITHKIHRSYFAKDTLIKETRLAIEDIISIVITKIADFI